MRKFRLFVVSTAVLGAVMYLKSAPQEVRSGSWLSSGAMTQARTGAAAVRLPDGRVLITGGTGVSGVLATAELFGATGSFSQVAPMIHARSQHVSVALEDGRVLVFGGKTEGDGVFGSAEFYDPTTNAWRDAGFMNTSRIGHTATVLSDGRVLIAGGQAGDVTHASLEIFDPGINRFETLPAQLSSARTRHGAALLPDGRILLAGGFSGGATLETTDIFDPRQGTVSRGPDLLSPREGFTATGLLDGRILLAGGAAGSVDLASAELFDPATLKFSATAAMTTTRRGHLAFLLPNNNRVLLVGGDASGSSAELFTPWRGSFRPTGNLDETRSEAAGAPVGLNGALVLAGGRSRALQLDSSRVYRFATLKTDKEEYAQGEAVTITGSGWQPGERVTLLVQALRKTGQDRTLTVTADPSGNISSSEYQQNDPEIGKTYVLNATGSTSEAQLRFASKASASLDQCGNLTNPACEWINGNLGSSKATYREGDSVPYRMLMDGVPLAAGNTLTIEWDTTQSGKHALDYLTTFNRTVTGANPCLGGVCSGSPSSFTIPTDSNVTNGGVTQIPGVFNLWGGTITGVSAYTKFGDYLGSSQTRITITFTAAIANPVMAWGGHIANRSDWGANNAAVNISGSPFHMRLVEICTGTGANTVCGGGNQDRSLSNDAVLFPGSIKIVKIVNSPNPSGTPFNYTSTLADLGSFSLVGNPSPGTNKTVTGISTFGTYTVTEEIPGGWQIDPSSGCTGDTSNPSTISPGGVATIKLDEGENITCTFVNALQPGGITIIKNTEGGNDTFGYTTTGGLSPSIFSLTTVSGTKSQTYSGVQPGPYTVTESAPPDGWQFKSLTCSVTGAGTTASPGTGQTQTTATINLAAGGSAICTYTNTKQGTIELKKTWVGTPGQTTLNIGTSAGGSQTASQPTGAAGAAPQTTGAKTVTAGPYFVSESGGLDNYSSSLACTDNGIAVTPGTNNSLSVADGHTVACTFTNTLKGTIELKKTWVGTPGQTTLNIGTSAGGSQTASQPTGAAGAAPQTTGAKTVTAGPYFVSESGGLDNYSSSLACTDNGAPVTPGTNNSLSVADGHTVACTFTNTLKGTIELKKTWVGTPGQTTLNIGTSAGGSQTASQPTGAAGAAPQTTGAKTVTAGPYFVSESGGLDNYSSSLACTDNGAPVTPGTNNSLSVADGHTVACTFTNTLKGTIELKKTWVGTPGQTTLNIGTSAGGSQTASQPTGAAGAAPQTTGAKTVTAGPYFVSESGGLDNYSSSLACTDNGAPVTPGTNNSLSVADGHTVACTFTNTLQQATLTITKVCAGAASSTPFSVNATLSGTDTPFSVGCDGSDSKQVLPGVYTVSELPKSGWTGPTGSLLNGWTSPTRFSGDCDASGNVTLMNGQSKTCFILNVNNTCTPAFSFPPTSQTGGATVRSVANSESAVPPFRSVASPRGTVPNPTRPVSPRNSTGNPVRGGPRK